MHSERSHAPFGRDVETDDDEREQDAEEKRDGVEEDPPGPARSIFRVGVFL